MSSDAAQEEQGGESLPEIALQPPQKKADMATIVGLLAAVGMIFAAIALGQSNANFFNVPSFMIVILGTMAATAISYTSEELGRAGAVIAKSTFRRVQSPSNMAENLLSLAVISKKKGILALAL